MQVLYTHGVGVARFAYLAAAGKHGEVALVNRAGVERAFRGVGEQTFSEVVAAIITHSGRNRETLRAVYPDCDTVIIAFALRSKADAQVACDTASVMLLIVYSCA